jgi:dihydrofolate synthase/folylpolyglutamate synthase
MSLTWHGRNQIINNNPDIIFDVGHNEDGIQSFLKFLINSKKSYRKKTLLLSIQKKKKIIKVSKQLDNFFDKKIYSITNSDRSMEYAEVQKYFNNIEYVESPDKALEIATKNSQKKDLIAIVGTHYWGSSLKDFFNICFDNI